MSKKSPVSDKFRFVTERSIKAEKYEITRWQSAQLRAKLPKGIFWQQLEKGNLVMWCWTLLQSYLIHGLQSPITQELIEEYISTLPKAS